MCPASTRGIAVTLSLLSATFAASQGDILHLNSDYELNHFVSLLSHLYLLSLMQLRLALNFQCSQGIT